LLVTCKGSEKLIIATGKNDSLLLRVLLDTLSVRAEHHDLPDGSSVEIPDLDDCLGLFTELGFAEATSEA
jgi:hypothetical protein